VTDPNLEISIEQQPGAEFQKLQRRILEEQAMDSGGRLVVASALRAREDAPGSRRTFVEVRVEDTGPGIPQKVLANLFVPFVTTKDRGTGLGLAISQRIVAAVGGHIEASTHEGVGSTFSVRLPVEAAPPPTRVVEHATPPSTPEAARERRIAPSR
jgi:signal transduction histidine kinase